MEIIKMTADHTRAVAELEKLCFSAPWSESSIIYELTNPLSVWLVAVDDTEVIGYVGSQTVLDAADMMNLAVAPAHRRRGVAENLILSLEEAIRVKGAASLTLEVRCSNEPAVTLYKKMGFEQVGCRPNYYRNPKEDALILRKEWSL